MHKLRYFASLLCAISVLHVARAEYGGGMGTVEAPYQIATAEDLIALGSDVNDYDKHFILTADIDLSAYSFQKAVIAPNTTDGNEYKGTSFTGCFSGGGHAIRSLRIRGDGYLGLFGYLGNAAQISDLGVTDANVAGSQYIGALAGYNRGSMMNCYSKGAVSGTQDYVGGLVGDNWGNLIRCYSTASTAGSASAGGLIGCNHYFCVADCYSTGCVAGGSSIGGLAGTNYFGYVVNCYSTGLVTGGDYAGGLVGSNYRGNVTNCHSVGPVTGSDGVGGLIGQNDGSIAYCYWNKVTSGQVTSDGGVGLTTAQMQKPASFAGWDWVGMQADGTSEIWLIQDANQYPVLASFNGYVPPQLKGQGTTEAPYEIHDANELGAIYHYSPCACYRLANSIDLADISWSAPVMPWFVGVFDGQQFAISHLTMVTGGYAGLFGMIGSASQVENIGVEESNVTGAGDFVGLLAGYNRGHVANCSGTGLVDAMSCCVGGLIGYNDRGGEIANCHTICSAYSSAGWVAMLVGYNCGAVAGCHSDGSAAGSWVIGGLVGTNDSGTVTNSYSTGSVEGGSWVGGLAGSNESGTLVGDYSTASVAGDGYVSGLVGWNSSADIANSFSTGPVHGTSYCVAGFVAYNTGGHISMCFSTGPVDGADDLVGGLVGYNSSDCVVASSYSAGSAKGRYFVGGLVGLNASSIVTESYSRGQVQGVSAVGGLVGSNSSGTVAKSFWDIFASGQSASAGGLGLTTAQMQDSRTFINAGWDFVTEANPDGVWFMLATGSYPLLHWQQTDIASPAE